MTIGTIEQMRNALASLRELAGSHPMRTYMQTNVDDVCETLDALTAEVEALTHDTAAIVDLKADNERLREALQTLIEGVHCFDPRAMATARAALDDTPRCVCKGASVWAHNMQRR